MGSLKTLALAGAMAVGGVALANAADFAPAPPMMPPAPEPLGLRGSVSSGIYLRGDVGVGQLKVKRYSQDDVVRAGGSFYGQTDSQAVFAGAGIGYRFNNWFRVDGTFEYRGGGQIGVSDYLTYNAGTTRVQQTNTYKGNLSSMVALFNGYVDLGTWNCLTPYIGAGIGYASNTISGMTDQGIVFAGGPSSATLGTARNGDKSGVAWALMAGLGYEVNKNLTLEVGYRYLNLGDAQSGRIQNAFLPESYVPLKAKEIESHDFRIGMRWNFGEPDCCGPTERPVYAPQPVVRKY
jgi:opacity protein-like surface antigen